MLSCHAMSWGVQCLRKFRFVCYCGGGLLDHSTEGYTALPWLFGVHTVHIFPAVFSTVSPSWGLRKEWYAGRNGMPACSVQISFSINTSQHLLMLSSIITLQLDICFRGRLSIVEGGGGGLTLLICQTSTKIGRFRLQRKFVFSITYKELVMAKMLLSCRWRPYLIQCIFLFQISNHIAFCVVSTS